MWSGRGSGSREANNDEITWEVLNATNCVDQSEIASQTERSGDIANKKGSGCC
jgi:hypothetical protein